MASHVRILLVDLLAVALISWFTLVLSHPLHLRNSLSNGNQLMDQDAIHQAADLLIGARRSGVLLDGLPIACRPRDIDDAHAIQDATVTALGDTVAGWKVNTTPEGRVVRGALLRSRIIPSGGSIAAVQVPLLGVEAEIAFRFDRTFEPRELAYKYTEVASAVTAFPAIEIVDSRYKDYRGTSLIERIADFVSNGAFVEGEAKPMWHKVDLSRLDVRLEIDDAVIVQHVGGHPAGDPLLPAIELVNDLRHTTGVKAGRVTTTGTYTGLNFAKPGQRVRAVFEGFGTVEVRLTA
jgi:2-keto-4-pentenoate hydratase